MTFTGPAVALRDIAAGLGGSPEALAWVTNAYMLAFGSFLMVAGALADRYGRRRVFLCGLAGFLATSAALLATPDIAFFDFLRGLQGIASAAVYAAGAAALAQEFDGRARLRAFSILGTSFGMGLTLGPLAAGWLTATWGWRAIFGLVIACAAVAWLIARPALRETSDPEAQSHALDWAGAVMFTLALSVFTWSALQAPGRGWGNATTIAGLVGAALLLAVFVRIERHAVRPLLDLGLFRYPRFVGVQLLAAAPAYGFVVLLVLLPIRFVGIEGLGTTQVGLAMMALSGPLVALPLLAGLLAHRIHPAALCCSGLMAAAAGLLWLATTHSARASLAPMMLIGAGISLPWGLMDGLAVSVVPRDRAGMATGIFSTMRVAGEGLALAIVSACLSALTAHRLTCLGSATPTTTIAEHLVGGDLAGAAVLCRTLTAPTLATTYQDAFSTLALILGAVTTLTAVVVFAFLAHDGHVDADDGVSSTIRQPI